MLFTGAGAGAGAGAGIRSRCRSWIRRRCRSRIPVAYTHLDVYKRQAAVTALADDAGDPIFGFDQLAGGVFKQKFRAMTLGFLLVQPCQDVYKRQVQETFSTP